MEPSVASVESMCNLLIRSRLLQAPDVQTMNRRWRLEAKDAAGDVERFAKWMVAKQYVTEYQAHALLRGHSDHFFLNHYKLLDRIGKGRMAGVYKAVHNLGNIVAIKILPPSRARDPQVFARFQRESRMSVRLKHPNVVRAFHTGTAGPLHYLVMEYLEGETLDDVLKRRGKLPPSEGVRLIHQALLGLQHIHEQGMVHRDLEPGNLMLVPSPVLGAPDNTLQATVKILDIGLGRALFDESEKAEAEDLQLTSQGTVLGSADYLSPEQGRDARKADIRSDIYSVGCILYHVLSGQTPFPDKNPFSQIVRHSSEPPRPIRQLEPAVPDGLQQIIINGMMAKDPSQRYATPERAAQALQVFLIAQEAPRPVEAGPQSYLNWVDEHSSEEALPAEAKSPTRPTPPATTKPAATPAVAAPTRPAEVAPAARTSPPAPVTAPVARTVAPIAVATAVPAAPSVEAEPAGVELVPFTERFQRLSRRDYFLLAIGIWLGAAGALVVAGILWLVLQSRQ